jgi:uncharacterized membrane protein YsdA (DUF1294 family)
MMIYLAVVNVLAFFLFGIDKYKAKHDRWRIKEATLIGIAVIGGSAGAWLGMRVWHHKTQHNQFKYGIPFIMLMQIAAAITFVVMTHPPRL